MNEYTLIKFIDDELNDGVMFEEILERFNLTPGEVFQFLFENGLIDEDLLHSYLLDIE